MVPSSLWITSSVPRQRASPRPASTANSFVWHKAWAHPLSLIAGWRLTHLCKLARRIAYGSGPSNNREDEQFNGSSPSCQQPRSTVRPVSRTERAGSQSACLTRNQRIGEPS